MNTRAPVILLQIPNKPYFLGTFDTVNFQNWWRSDTLPDDIIKIKRGFHIYGRTHLAICQRRDERWGIYRSKDYGIHWERVFLAEPSEIIYEAVVITFGWVIINTSTGFYESINAGTTWSKICELPAAPVAPAFTNIGSGDVLMCTDGHDIWKSTNYARSWAKVCDGRSVPIWRDIPGRVLYGYYSGPSKPAIAGSNGRVLSANGPYLLVSNDNGATWSHHRYWHTDLQGQARYDFMPPRNIVADRCNNPANPQFLITNLIITQVDGPAINQVHFLMKCDDLQPVAGEPGLYSRYFVTYLPTVKTSYGSSLPSTDEANNFWKYILRRDLAPDENANQLSAYEAQITSTDQIGRLVFSTFSKTVNGQNVVGIQYSKDGGATWAEIDTENVRVYEGESPTFGGTFMDDNYSKSTWIAPACDNSGKFTFQSGIRHQCQSYEVDVLMENAWWDIQKPYSVDMDLEKTVKLTESLDVEIMKAKPKPYQADIQIQGEQKKLYAVDKFISDNVHRTYSIVAELMIKKLIENSVAATVELKATKSYLNTLAIDDINARTYEVAVKIVRDDLAERLSDIERINPQIFDLWLPEKPYFPYDSRRETL